MNSNLCKRKKNNNNNNKQTNKQKMNGGGWMRGWIHTSKSDAVNSYGIFHPKAPNFFLSCTTALKKHRPNNSLFQAGPGPESSQTASVTTPPTPPRERNRLALIPGGGSTVICNDSKQSWLIKYSESKQQNQKTKQRYFTLSPACRMETGNAGSGFELNHMRKFGSTIVSGWDNLKEKYFIFVSRNMTKIYTRRLLQNIILTLLLT